MKKIYVYFKKIVYLVLIFLFCIGLHACSKEPIEKKLEIDLGIEEVYKYHFSLHDEFTMPIGAWSDPPPANFAGIYNNPDLITDEQYKLIKASGINAIYGLYNNVNLNLEGVLRSLDHAYNNDIVYLVRDSQVTGSYDDEDFDRLVKTLDLYKNKPAFGGVMVIDEPGVVSFNNLGNLHKNFQHILPDKAFYINMLPNYASRKQLINGATSGNLDDASMTYERYMREYIEIVKPKFYSFDFYPFVGMNYGQMRKGYFDQLSQVREICNEAKIPYWVFIQASSWAPNSLRVPNQVEVYWQVSTALAYGAKGIQYFMYYTSMEEGVESFAGGMVDKYGNKNPMYDYVKNANQHLLSIDHILMDSVHKGVMVNGKTPDEIPVKDILSSFSVLQSISGDDALVGCFNYRGKPVYYVVNNSLTKDIANINLELSQEVEYNLYQKTNQSSNKSQKINLQIPAGEGVLIEITK